MLDQHAGGIAIDGVFRALRDNLMARMDGNTAIQGGGSSITQQVAKNFLLTNEVSMARKIKEALLAMKIERTFSKEKILELYLNEIYLGLGAYGVAAASLLYFDKSVHELTVAEAAYLAALPKAPNNYRPERHEQRAIARRNWVLAEMERNGFITAAQRAEAQAAPLGTVRGPKDSVDNVGGYFMEEVRRTLVERYGIDAEDGPNDPSRYAASPSAKALVRTSPSRTYAAPTPTPGRKISHRPEPMGASWCPWASHPLKSPIRPTLRAFGAHRTKLVPGSGSVRGWAPRACQSCSWRPSATRCRSNSERVERAAGGILVSLVATRTGVSRAGRRNADRASSVCG